MLAVDVASDVFAVGKAVEVVDTFEVRVLFVVVAVGGITTRDLVVFEIVFKPSLIPDF